MTEKLNVNFILITCKKNITMMIEWFFHFAIHTTLVSSVSATQDIGHDTNTTHGNNVT